MLVRPLPGANRHSLLTTLKHIGAGATELRGDVHGHEELYYSYCSWVTDSVRSLQSQVSPADVERLLLTRRYWALQSLADAEVSVNTHYSLDNELDERVAAFEDAASWLHEQIGRWSGRIRFVVADTSVYCDHEQKLEELDVSEIVGARDKPVSLVVPIAIIDELDSLKRSKDRRVRWRAGYTLAVLDRVLDQPEKAQVLRKADRAQGRGKVMIEIVLDPPGHQRLPITDEEIIDRTLAVQALAGRDLTLITYDTGQSMRARAQGLQVVKLDYPRSANESEPT